ncbi:sodium:solute symporter [Proteus mirabilis]|nr:sodium:solute symporter [Proteus mirabilis]
MLIKSSFFITLISLFISIVVFYLETVHEFFFKLYPHSVNAKIVIEIQKILSYSFFSYLIALALITLFFIKKINFNKKFRFIIYLLIPYIINMIVWYFNGYQVINYKYTSVMVTDFLFISYIIHFIFIIPIIAYILDYTFRFKIKK